jgi:hypothetical protein
MTPGEIVLGVLVLVSGFIALGVLQHNKEIDKENAKH